MIGLLMTNKESAEESESFPTRQTGPRLPVVATATFFICFKYLNGEYKL